MQKPPAYVLRLATGCEERAHSYRTQNTVTSSSAERSLLKAETEYMEGTRAAGRRPFMPDSALNRRSEALSGWKHNKCPLLPLNYPENHLKDQLRTGDKSLVGNKGYRRYLKVEGSGHFVIDEKQVKAEERYDGIWVLRTNTVYNSETVAHVYKALWTAEDIIRTSKSILETRPIYHKRDASIRGHVFCSFLALVLKQELESRMKEADLEWEWKEVIRGLDGLQQVEPNFQGRRFLFRSQLTAHASQAVRATGVAIPPTLQELQ